ncbi:MAG: hypothetical protein HYS32_01580 [Candidatus Woesearchaeota archaeon]|nr:MAG: hypothetical protein HYS32_01580 [Candidatus Woesearchaeota archaeon]
MIKIGYGKIIEKIKEQTSISDSELNSRVERKLQDLSGLISREGAAHIVANELGINLFESIGKGLVKINDLLVGMRKVTTAGKVTNVFSVNEFKTEKRKGKVGSFIIGDETGRVRVVLWDENHIKEMENGNIKEGAIVKVESAYVRENNSFKEVHLGNQGNLIVNPDGLVIESVANARQTVGLQKKVEQLEENDFNVRIAGTLVQVFEPRFYEICEECGRKLIDEEGNKKCLEHGRVTPKKAVVANFFLDDGTGVIRCVAFRDQGEFVIGKENLDSINEENNFDDIKLNIEGKQLALIGKVNKNQMFDRLEFVANSVYELDADKILQELQS